MGTGSPLRQGLVRTVDTTVMDEVLILHTTIVLLGRITVQNMLSAPRTNGRLPHIRLAGQRLTY